MNNFKPLAGRKGLVVGIANDSSVAWGCLHVLVHSIAFAPAEDVHGRVTDCSLEGFQVAMDVSCHSFIRMARLAEPARTDGFRPG